MRRKFSAIGCNTLDEQTLRAFPAAAAAGLREGCPVVLPVAGDAGEQAGVGSDAFVSAQHHAASVDKTNFSHRLARAHSAAALIEKVKQLARERQLHPVLRRRGLRVVEKGENFGARIHTVNRFRFDGQPVPD